MGVGYGDLGLCSPCAAAWHIYTAAVIRPCASIVRWLRGWDVDEEDTWLVLLRFVMGFLFWEECIRMVIVKPTATTDAATGAAVLGSKLLTKMVDSHLLVPLYYAEQWLPPLPHYEGLVILHYVQAVAAVALAVGFNARLSALALFCVRGWMFLANQAFYLNHHYAELLLLAPLCVVDSAASLSVDALIRTPSWHTPRPVARYIRWTFTSVPVAIYLYGAYSKLSYDWLRAANVGEWFVKHNLVTHVAAYSPALAGAFDQSAFVDAVYRSWILRYIIAYGGIAWDATAPFLCTASFRPLGVAAVLGVVGTFVFHTANHLHLRIGMFPVMGVSITAVLFWFRPREYKPRPTRTRTKKGARRCPNRPHACCTSSAPPRTRARRYTWRRAVGVTLAVLFVSWVALSPLRDVVYTDTSRFYDKAGQTLAWAMKLYSVAVNAAFSVKVTPYVRMSDDGTRMRLAAPTQRSFRLDQTPLLDVDYVVTPPPPLTDDANVDPAAVRYPSVFGTGMPLMSTTAAARITADPDALRRVARKVAALYETTVCPIILNTTDAACHVQFYASGTVRANGRRPELFYNESIDLADQRLSHWPSDWLIPLAPAEGWLRYDNPLVFLWEFVRGRGDTPCLPWNRLDHNRATNANDLRCASWWYSTVDGERQRLAASTTFGDRVAKWIAAITAPPLEGYNDDEACEEALTRFFASFAPLACAFPYEKLDAWQRTESAYVEAASGE